MRKTKIVCTIGPATDSEEMISRLMDAGMNVCRLNMSHGSYEEHGRRIELIQRLRREKKIPVAIMLDTKGPEVRTKTLKEGKVTLVPGQEFMLTTREVEGDAQGVGITYERLPSLLKAGDRLSIDDGLLSMVVRRVENGTDIICEALNGGVLGERKGISVPEVDLQMPSIGEKDRSDILFGIEHGIDLIAASFVCRAGDVLTIRKLCADNGGSGVRIFSKIENRMGVNNFDQILKVSDGIMVARGDLGVEVDMEEVPVLQKEFIHKCNLAAKPVITATQMLDSMIRNPRPTRAEASDVANAIIDGTDAIMLSGETAAGKYPLEAVNTMVRIASYIESHQLNSNRFKLLQEAMRNDTARTVANAVSYSCCQMASDLNAAAIITPSNSGTTARMVARFRPRCPVIAPTPNEQAYHQLGLSFGVIPAHMEVSGDTDTLINAAVAAAESSGYVQPGDIAIISAGVPTGVSGTTNLIKAHIVGNVLLRGQGVGEGSASGKACVVNTLSDLESDFRPGDVIVTKMTTGEMLPYLRQAGAVVVESTDPECHAAITCLALGIPLFMDRTEQAVHMLKRGMTVTVDAEKGFLYNGVKK
ncbi:MAG: pyruvate kinase [Clostridia bacterium]|nr:pyruvate kinase [Clostridia bacterium]